MAAQRPTVGGPSTLTGSLGAFLASPANCRLREGGPADERPERRVGPVRRGLDDPGDDPPVHRGCDALRRDRIIENGPPSRGAYHERRIIFDWPLQPDARQQDRFCGALTPVIPDRCPEPICRRPPQATLT